MADSRSVVIVAASIGAVATVAAALIARSDDQPVTPPAPGTTTVTATSTLVNPPTPTPTPAVPTQEPPRPPAVAPSGDLALSRPITRPSCDGRFVVFVGAAVHPPGYRTEVQRLLDAYPGSEYLRAADTCSSLRHRDEAGHQIYAVYYGPFPDRAQACDVRTSGGPDSYVKVLDEVTPPGAVVEC